MTTPLECSRARTAPAAAASSALFAAIARARGERSIHPDGDGYEARFTPEGVPLSLAGEAALAHAGPRAARVRFSRGFGLPEPWPELSSVAVKLPDLYGPEADQDLLMSAVWGSRPVLRHVFRPGRSHLGRFYSSVLPFSLAGRVVLFGARVQITGAGASSPARPAGRSAGDLGELARAAADGGLAVRLFVATVRGAWEPLGSVAVGRRLAPEHDRLLRFNPAHLGGGIGAAGRFNAVRAAGYAGSQAGRRRA